MRSCIFAAIFASAVARRRLRHAAVQCTNCPVLWSKDPTCYCPENSVKLNGFAGWTCAIKQPGVSGFRSICSQNQLAEGDICYQFYEDGSRPFINQKNSCPVGTKCRPVNNGYSLLASVMTCQVEQYGTLFGASTNVASDFNFNTLLAASGVASARSNGVQISDATLGYIWNVPKTSISSSVIKDLNTCLNKFQITTTERLRHFLSQTAHESGGGRWTKELSNGNYLEGRSDLGNVYPGDGPRFKGAGYLQLTGRVNYEKLRRYTGDNRVMEGVNYVAAKYPFTSAGVWWQENNMNSLIDSGASVYTVTRRVNGGTNGLADREMYYRRTKDVIA